MQAWQRPDAVHAIYAVVTYATGYAAWEIPRTVLQERGQYAMSWRRELAALSPSDFPLASAMIEELSRVAGPEQFEIGLNALTSGISGAGASS